MTALPEGMAVTIHPVLAGAYRVGSPRTLLTHASQDGGDNAICKRVEEYSLCPEIVVPQVAPTCPLCRRKLEKLDLEISAAGSAS
jgi:hypothetical protein